MNNFIVDENRFNLAGPPKWWLQKLWEFDPELVVLPSRQGFYYRLAQRNRKLTLPEQMAQEILKEQADTRMLASYALVPVTTILATANWSNPLMWVDLEQRAPWRQGGAEKVIKHIEDAEFDKHLRTLKEEDERLEGRAKEAWKAYQYKAGSTSRHRAGQLYW